MSTAPGPVRREGREKVTGAARYAAEHTPPGTVYAWPVPATVPRGRILSVDDAAAMAEPGALAVLTHENAPRLKDTEDRTLLVLQNDRVPHRGWYVALAVAETPEAARAMAAAVRIGYAAEEHDAELRDGHPRLYTPEEVNAGLPAVRERGDFDAAYARAAVRVDAAYSTPGLHNHPMEPHATTARWEDGRLVAYDSSQGSSTVQETLAGLFGMDKDLITVVSEHVGGGFGCKGTPRPQVVLAALAARHTCRPVKLALPRNQLVAVVGHRAPVLQRVRLGAGDDGVIDALAHEVITQTSTVRAFVEQAAAPSRAMYVSPHSRTTHRVVQLDVPSPSWMRAPGECPGMFALECAMDELAEAAGVDPVELRVRNDTSDEPDSGKPFSSRHLVECLREGARHFGWEGRDPRPRSRTEGRLLVGTGVASSYYPVFLMPSAAEARVSETGRYQVRVNATDIGTGARTVLAQIAAEVLGVAPERVAIEIGSSSLPCASVAGGSSGTGSWGWAVHKACTALTRAIDEHGGTVPPGGLAATADTADDIEEEPPHARAAFGAQFAEVAVDQDTGEVRVRRHLGVFAAGRILNARTARSQLVGGMIMGMGMALLEGSTMDLRYGDFAERDLASYHVPACADVRDVEAHWIDEHDPHLNPMGTKGIGEIGIVGAAAAVANAIRHATGVRVRDLPALPEKLLAGLG
ncbi:xanthine dehydrogenase family protein molybdopterin-binding subunit [Streptomyces sp. URMC 124]|uniref:xanthine dehydrogenase family protein molybdopterin-binding subunit n=1 Tax=Streptomyces sp. URMC 124 TaxID=3423405 RepID=UPI003F1BDF74